MNFWDRVLSPACDKGRILAKGEEHEKRFADPRWDAYKTAVASASELRTDFLDTKGPVVRIGRPEELSAEKGARLDAALDAFRPWKKGPYEIFGRAIDSEWRSDLKWERFLPSVKSLAGEVVADIGCHNGYFMYRMREQGAKAVMGFEPVPVNALNFQLLQAFHPTPDIALTMFGVEDIDLFPETFDTIFCLGILYHHTDPVGLLRKMRTALKPKGRLYIDCQGIPGDRSEALIPAGRYAGASGVWFLPTMAGLENWVKRSGYSKMQRIYSAPLSSEEQRRTAWADVDSLQDFLQPNDASLSKEGYPAPWRHYLLAQA